MARSGRRGNGGNYLGAIGRHRSLALLGFGASLARAAGLGRALDRARNALDARFVRAERPPLRATIDDEAIYGFLRHRSFLAEVTRPATTYRELFVRQLRPGLTVIDGGAHIGLYTVLASRGVGPLGRVIAFEPDPYNFTALAYNVRRQGARNVTLRPKALAETPRRATFHLSRGTIGSALRPRVDTEGHLPTDVTSIDAELTGEPPDELLVKLNVEGAEPLVLDGMRETLARVQRIAMFVELDPLGLRSAGFEPEAFVAKLDGLGFRVSAIRLSDQSLGPPAPSRKGHLFCERA